MSASDTAPSSRSMGYRSRSGRVKSSVCSVPTGPARARPCTSPSGCSRPDEGRVEIGPGASPADAAVRRRIGVAPQALAVYDQLTGRENVEFFGRMSRPLWRCTVDTGRLGPRVRAAWRPRGRSGGSLLGRYEAPPEPRCRAGARPRAPAVGRANGWSRPPVPERHLRKHRDTAARGPDSHLHHALHGRGRAALRSRRHYRPRQAAGGGHGPGAARPVRRRTDTGARACRRRAPRPDHGSARRTEPPRPRRARSASSVVERPTLEQVFLHLTGRQLRD